MTLRIGAVVLHYRYWPGVRECLERLESQSLLPARTVVVDNASDDGSIEHVARAFPAVEILRRPWNLGYSEAMNAALRLLDGSGQSVDAVLLMTHDCRLAPGTLQCLADRLEARADLGAAGPLLGLHQDPARVYAAGGTVDARTWDTKHVGDPRRTTFAEWSDQPPHEVRWLDGACVLLRMQAWREVGPYDERYFLYYEDVDYGLRLGAAGWAVECVPAAHAWHRTGSRSPLLAYLVTRNHLMLIHHHAPIRLCARQLAREVVWMGRDVASGDAVRVRRARARARGVFDFLLVRTGPPRPGRSIGERPTTGRRRSPRTPPPAGGP